MEELARSAGYVVVRDGRRLILADVGTRVLAIAIFVAGLITVILGINGVVNLALGLGSSSGLVLGACLLAGSAVPGVVLAVLIRAFRRRRKAPLRPDQVVCIVDLERRLVLLGDGTELGEIDACRLVRVFQMTSSSSGLALDTPRGRVALARGDPFSGSVKPLAAALATTGLPWK